jgi:hypothetical protein
MALMQLGTPSRREEGAFLPGVTAVGIGMRKLMEASVPAQVQAKVTIPIYQGGAASARVRQAKEQLGQQRILVDSVPAGQSSSRLCLRGRKWKRRKLTIEANRAQLSAANLALNGVVEERRVGQRTTLDVLNAQQSVLNAKEAISNSERNSIVASFSVLGLNGQADDRSAWSCMSPITALKFTMKRPRTGGTAFVPSTGDEPGSASKHKASFAMRLAGNPVHEPVNRRPESFDSQLQVRWP